MTNLLITNGYSTAGTTDELTHLNGNELLTDNVDVLRSFATDLLALNPTVGP